MKSFDLSDWALGHRSLVWYFMIAFMAAGLFSYLHLGRQEDPDFTVQTMVIQAQWPGASAEEITRQVTERIEKSSKNWNRRLHQKCNRCRTDDGLRLSARQHQGQGRYPDLGSRAQHGRRHQERFSSRRHRTFF